MVYLTKQSSNQEVDFDNSLKEMKNNFVKQGYDLERIRLLNRVDLIRGKDTRRKSNGIPLVITYNRFLPDITKTIKKNWNIL